MNIQEIIDYINKECKMNCITKKQLSEKADISINTFKKFENNKEIKLSTLLSILKVINTKLILKVEDKDIEDEQI